MAASAVLWAAAAAVWAVLAAVLAVLARSYAALTAFGLAAMPALAALVLDVLSDSLTWP